MSHAYCAQVRDLEIWQLARELYRKISIVAEVLRAAKEFRFSEQMKSAAGSVMDNIAEGFERNGRLELLNSLSISKGECGELKSQLYRALDDAYIDKTWFEDLYQVQKRNQGKLPALSNT